MLILASASQSRKNLLEKSAIKFHQISSNFDEAKIKNNNISNLAMELSYQKANSVLKKIKDKNINVCIGKESLEILGCDSIFEFKGKAFGKPHDKSEAYDRWIQMSGDKGNLHTGHSLLFCEFDQIQGNYIIRNEVKEVISSKIFFSDL